LAEGCQDIFGVCLLVRLVGEQHFIILAGLEVVQLNGND
jgi:hypothetical protein